MNDVPKKLNLGCGFFPKDGFLNLDKDKNYPADIFHDLESFPWPLPNDHFEYIILDHVLEHLTDLESTIKEIEKLLKKGGILEIKVPHFSRGFTHWDHKRGFDVTFPIYFDPSTSGSFRNTQLKPVSTKLRWFSQPDLKKKHLSKTSYFLGSTLGFVFDFIGNINLFFTSRLLSFWVGGYEEIQFVFKK